MCHVSVTHCHNNKQQTTQKRAALNSEHFPLGNRKLVCYICDYISVLYVGSFVPFFFLDSICKQNHMIFGRGGVNWKIEISIHITVCNIDN